MDTDDLDLDTLLLVKQKMEQVQAHLSGNDEDGQAQFGHAMAVVWDLIGIAERHRDTSEKSLMTYAQEMEAEEFSTPREPSGFDTSPNEDWLLSESEPEPNMADD